MTIQANSLIALSLATAIAGGSVGYANACGFDGIMLNGFEALHPKSIDVSIAIRAAYDAGIVDKSAIDPITPGSAGYWRAVGHLSSLRRSLGFDDASTVAPAISVLLVDSSLWSRMSPDAGPNSLQVHTEGAQPRDVVVITNEAVPVAILERRLSAELALDQGLVRVEGDGPDTERVRQAILQSANASEEAATGRARVAPFFNVKRQ